MAVFEECEEKQLRKAGYFFAGKEKHSAIKVCLWCKNSLLGKGECYKSEFYGIRSWRCLQTSVTMPFCDHKCVFCWRNTEITFPEWVGEATEPREIMDEAIEAQRKALNGFPGNEKADLKKWKEAQAPKHVALSLSGETTLYPKLGELIKEIHMRGMTSFIVSNGIHPEAIEELEKEEALPTQLYFSLVAWDEESYKRICRPLKEGTWKRFLESMKLMKKLKGKTRTVLRMTLIAGMNDAEPREYAKIIKLAEPDYVEVKGYMALGGSRDKIGVKGMKKMEEIREYAEGIAEEAGYLVSAEHVPSRVVLLCRDEKAESKRKLKLN